jgi:trans-aconitate methyltransferase
LITWLARHGPAPAQVRVLDKVTSAWICQAIGVAATLRIPDAIAERPRTAAEVADALALDPDAVARLMRVLASEGFVLLRDGRFALSELGRVLTSDHPGSVRELAVLCSAEWYEALGGLAGAVTNGACAFEQVRGLPFFDYLAEHPSVQRSFNAGMRAASALADATLPLAYDFSRFERVVDVGGGTGSLLGMLLRRYPRLHGVLFDLGPVCDEAAQRWAASPLLERLTFERGDFRQRVPSGGDLYVLKTVLHDWGDSEAIQILSRCREAMCPGARLLVIEHVLDQKPRPQFAQRLDLLMLAVLGGKERTYEQYDQLLRAAGLQVLNRYPSLSELTLIEVSL